MSTSILFSLILAKHTPNKIAKKITCNIFPSTNDLNGFSGMMFKKTEAIEGGEFTFTIFSFEVTETELPGSRKVPTARETVIAINVVNI